MIFIKQQNRYFINKKFELPQFTQKMVGLYSSRLSFFPSPAPSHDHLLSRNHEDLDLASSDEVVGFLSSLSAKKQMKKNFSTIIIVEDTSAILKFHVLSFEKFSGIEPDFGGPFTRMSCACRCTSMIGMK
jgi:hypothetical protein